MRHASAKTTLDTYGHLWPDRDESSRALSRPSMQRGAIVLRTHCVPAARKAISNALEAS